jgi:TetR/AcrR family transcriptional repressor of bet genes
MPRPSRSDERRQQIAAALMRTMAKRGYAGASVASIAREAGLAPGLVHYYFESKQAILLELMREIRGGILARFADRLDPTDDDPWKRLYAFTDAFLEHDPTGGTAPLQATWLVISAEAIHQPAVRERYRGMLLAQVERIDRLLRDVLKREGRSVRNARSLAVAIVAAIQGVYQVDAALPGASKPGSSAPALRQMIAGLVAAAPQARKRTAPKRRTAARRR